MSNLYIMTKQPPIFRLGTLFAIMLTVALFTNCSEAKKEKTPEAAPVKDSSTKMMDTSSTPARIMDTADTRPIKPGS
jgi:hypothetical protein